MARKVRVVLNRKAFDRQILHELPAPVLDDVQKQMEGMARIDPPSPCTATTTGNEATWSPPLPRRSNRRTAY